MAQLVFSICIYSPDDTKEQYSIVNPADKTDYIEKLWIATNANNKKHIYHKRAALDRNKDYEHLTFGEEKQLAADNKPQKNVQTYRIKTFPHFGTYGFITYDNKRKGSSEPFINAVEDK